jgi:Mg-chelatase subunit ChlD
MTDDRSRTVFGRKKSAPTLPGGPARTVELVRSSGPAVDLTKVRDAGHVDLTKRAEKAGLALSRRGLDGIRAEVVAVLDYSGSMHGAYGDGTVQTITERALGLGLQVDPDGRVPVIRFGSSADVVGDAMVSNYQGFVDREVARGRMGSTNLTAALELVLELAKETTAPLFVFVVTDGTPDDRRSAEAMLAELTRYPVFVKILATTSSAWTWLEMLDDALPGRLVDNLDAKFIGDPAGMADLAFAEAMADEWDSWVAGAIAAGILRSGS